MGPFTYQQFRVSCASNPYYKVNDLEVCDVLRDPIARSVDMRFESVRMNGNSLEKVRRAVRSAHILSFRVPQVALGKGLPARYFEEYDCMFIADWVNLNSPWERSYVFHEALHARQDLRGKPTREIADETAAFIYQAMVLRKFGRNLTNLPVGTTNVPVWTAAFPIADTLLSFGAVNPNDTFALKKAMLAIPVYANAQTKMIMNNVFAH